MKKEKLPTSVKVNLWDILGKGEHNEALWDAVSEYLSEKYGYCHNGYCLPNTIEIEITDIDWDTEE